MDLSITYDGCPYFPSLVHFCIIIGISYLVSVVEFVSQGKFSKDTSGFGPPPYFLFLDLDLDLVFLDLDRCLVLCLGLFERLRGIIFIILYFN